MCRYSFYNTVQQLKNEKLCGAWNKLAHTLSNGMIQLLSKTCSLVEWELKSYYLLLLLSLLRDTSVYFICIWRMPHMIQVRLHIPFWSQKLTLHFGFLFYLREKQKHPLFSVLLIRPGLVLYFCFWNCKKNFCLLLPNRCGESLKNIKMFIGLSWCAGLAKI